MWPNEFASLVVDMTGLSTVKSQAMVGMMAMLLWYSVVVLLPAGVISWLIERRVK